MKELAIEEKARRYDETLAMAKECITHIPDEAVNKYMLNMFPELKVSEDERIKKRLTDLLRKLYISTDYITHTEHEEILHWLEKQGEQKSSWSEEDENSLSDVLWCCKKAASIAKDENEMGTVWCAERWLKSLKSKL